MGLTVMVCPRITSSWGMHLLDSCLINAKSRLKFSATTALVDLRSSSPIKGPINKHQLDVSIAG